LAHTFALNGGWLDLSDAAPDPAGATANDWPALSITQTPGAPGGVIGPNDAIHLGPGEHTLNIGAGPGAAPLPAETGVFVIIDADPAGTGAGTARLTGANLYAGHTRIDSGTLLLTADAQAGDPAAAREIILNGGALAIAAPGFTTSRPIELRAPAGEIHTAADTVTTWAAINKNTPAPGAAAGAALAKTGPGTLVIAGASAATSLDIAEGRYVALRASGAGAGAVTIAPNATFELRAAPGGTLANPFAGAGTLLVNAGTATFATGTSTIANIIIENRADITLATPSFGDAATAIRLDASRLNLGRTDNALGRLTLAAATLRFIPSAGVNTGAGPYRYATLATLDGTGTIALNANLAAGIADRLYITGAAAGAFPLAVSNTGAPPETHAPALTLVSAPASAAPETFTLAGGRLETAGILAYDLVSTVDDGARRWQLRSAGALGNLGRLAHELAGALPLAALAGHEPAFQRMGELRAGAAALPRRPALSTWLRGRAEKLEYNNTLNGVAFDEKHYAATAGADCKLPRLANALHLGAFAGYARIERDPDRAGAATSDSFHAGLYETFSTPAGWYLDATLKLNRFTNRYAAAAVTGERITARYATAAAGAAVEIGKNTRFAQNWFFEPSFQAAFNALAGKVYTTSSNLEIEQRHGTASQLRAALRAGRALVTRDGQYLQLYARAAAARQRTAGAEIAAGGAVFKTALDCLRTECAAGAIWLPVPRAQVTLDLATARAAAYRLPWQVTAGLRWVW
ncbi:MAG: autotransporter outer membrane beta-barrel domain-containing protein, partial [Opitutaceae bacterium]|nr:autotransporter outer membrane beta-barrel domain-containing protein [Opitutaceae bacterium]